jgi:hypothetical protein
MPLGAVGVAHTSASNCSLQHKLHRRYYARRLHQSWRAALPIGSFMLTGKYIIHGLKP